MHPPVQCFNCQRVGHTAQGCRARTRCLVCGENHNKEVCQAVIEKCANCTGSHKANSKYYPKMKNALEVEKLKALKGETHESAQIIINSQRQRSARVFEANSSQINSILSRESGRIESTERVLYSTKAKRNIVQLNGDEQIYSLSRESQGKQNGRSNTLESKTVATQTETVASETPCQTLNRQFFDELKNFLLDIFQGNIVKESPNAQALLIEAAIRNNFGAVHNRDKGERRMKHCKKPANTHKELSI